jgi:uncharacterized protein DUF6632
MAVWLGLAHRALGLSTDDCRNLRVGVFLIMASRDPLKHLSLIWFTVWSSLVHAAIMGIQSFESPQNHGHLVGDVRALIIAAVVLALLTPRGQSEMPLGTKTY